ncbi:hypothetical protein [Streptomyces litchfieldiae]|uniref:Uncharacterized protein n=1 Tax=Streptomyces litchfieldiae TaxID=3075543 RepID=A0ABU2MUM7_9ACTN|nr:hypothetical protein [Streptomyces sp. DSM 44938]MDT0345348.1 hypothetical protein [Streptomyces sp. DSM 44938]
MSQAGQQATSEQDLRPPRRYSLITPTEWFRIPLRSQEKRERSVRVLLDRTYPNRDEHAARRRELRELLSGLVDRAAHRDGLELYLSTQAVLGVPVPASLLVLVEPENPALPSQPPVELLADGLRAKYGKQAEVTTVRLPSGPSVRCRRQVLGEGALELGQTADRPSTALDHYLPRPHSTAWLVLTFTTPIPELANAQVEMFDAIAASLQWS